MIDKRALMDAVLESLAAQANAMRASAAETRKGATHEESRAENDKDTRGLEATYLARGQAMRVEELESAASTLRFLELRAFGEEDPIGPGAIVTLLLDDDSRATYFLVPCEGGLKVRIDDLEVQLVTSAAPLGRALLDKNVGDQLTLKLAGRERDYQIDAVQ